MSGLRVMVVNEEPVLRDTVCQLVQGQGFEAYPAADGIDALRQIYYVKPQVMVCDAELPMLSGFELLPFVRRRFPQIGVIALVHKTSLDAGSAYEFADVIIPADPFHPQLLTDTVRGLMEAFPFRNADGFEDRGAEDSRDSCPKCDKLQLAVWAAKMHSMLAKAYRGLHPGDDKAVRQDEDATTELLKAMTVMAQHRAVVHGETQSRLPHGQSIPTERLIGA